MSKKKEKRKKRITINKIKKNESSYLNRYDLVPQAQSCWYPDFPYHLLSIQGDSSNLMTTV